MSIQGTIFSAETSKNYAETITHLAKFVNTQNPKELEQQLLAKTDLVQAYFTQRGSLTLDATRTLVHLERQGPSRWEDTWKIDTCTSKDLPDKIKAFWESDRQVEGWIISLFLPETGTYHPHQMPIVLEKREKMLYFITNDTRKNFELIRTVALEPIHSLKIQMQLFLSTQKRQHDWSTCSQLSRDDLHLFETLGTVHFCKFLETHADSIETQSEEKWRLVVSKRIPLPFMRLVQNLEDFRTYETWTRQKGIYSETVLSKFKQRLQSKNPSNAFDIRSSSLNNRIVYRYHKNLTKLINRILINEAPQKTLETPKSKNFQENLDSKQCLVTTLSKVTTLLILGSQLFCALKQNSAKS